MKVSIRNISNEEFFCDISDVVYPRLDSSCIVSIVSDKKTDTLTIVMDLYPSQMWKDNLGGLTLGETEESKKKDSTLIWTKPVTVV